MDFDDLDFDDYSQNNQQESNEESVPQQEEHQEDNTSTNDAISDYLKTIGIKDSNNIKFDDGNGGVVNKSWNDLTEDEKFNILKTPNVKYEEPENGLNDSEIEFINYLRDNGLSPEEYQQYIYSQGQQQAPQPKMYTVDNLSDDELYLADMQLRAKDMTDEELQNALEVAKANPDTYQKQIAGLRQEYKGLEDQKNQEEQAEYQAQQQEQYQKAANQIFDSIDNFNSIGSMDIQMTDEDKDQLAQFILGKDGAGVSYIQKALSDPQNVVAASWFLLNGQDTFDQIQDYISQVAKNARQAGYQEGLKQSGNKPPVVINRNPDKPLINPNTKKPVSIDDIDF